MIEHVGHALIVLCLAVVASCAAVAQHATVTPPTDSHVVITSHASHAEP